MEAIGAAHDAPFEHVEYPCWFSPSKPLKQFHPADSLRRGGKGILKPDVHSLYIYATDREWLLAGPVLNISSLFHPARMGQRVSGLLCICDLVHAFDKEQGL